MQTIELDRVMITRKQANFSMPEEFIGVVNELAARGVGGKGKWVVVGAALLQFLETPVEDQNEYLTTIQGALLSKRYAEVIEAAKKKSQNAGRAPGRLAGSPVTSQTPVHPPARRSTQQRK